MPSLIDLFLPDLMCETYRLVPFDTFRERGVSVVVFDIDNTLVSYETAEPDEPCRAFLKEMEQNGFSLAFVSNNSPERVERFNRFFNYFSVPDAKKPSKKALDPVLKRFGVSPKNVLFVGDQLLTDVLCARRCGTFSVTVSPIKKKENLFFRFKRMLERPLTRIYHKRKEEQK